MSMDLTELADRLVRAEAEIVVLRTVARRSRRLRTILEVAVIAALAIVMASTRSTTTQAQGAGQTITGPFVVKGPGGNKIFEVKESQDRSQSQVLLYDSQEQVKAAMMTISNGSGLVAVRGSTDRFVAGLTADGDGNGQLAVNDNQGQPIVDIKKGPNAQGLAVYRPGTDGKMAITALSSASAAGISVRNNDDVASGLGVTDDATFDVVDRTGQPIIEISGAGEAAPGEPPTPESSRQRGLRMYGANGKVAIRAHVDEKGSGRFGVLGEDGSQTLMGVHSSGSGAELLLAGPNATVNVELTSERGLALNTNGSQPVVELGFGKFGGSFMIAANEGQIMLEGGVLDSKRGIMRAGPRIGGPIPSTGLPFAIMGLSK